MEKKSSLRIESLLNSFSQVVLVENKLSGLLILLAVAIGDFRGVFFALLAAIAANESAKALGKSKEKIRSGIYGYCAVLIGIAGAVYFGPMGAFLLSLAGGLFSVPCMDIFEKKLQRSHLPVLTAPFVVIVSMTILIGYVSPVFHQGQGGQMIGIPVTDTNIQVVDALLKGFGQIFLLNNVVSSLLIAAAIFLARPNAIFLTLFSILLVFISTFLLRIDQSLLSDGLLTYNTILTVLAVEGNAGKMSGKLWGTVTVAIFVTFLVHGSLSPLLSIAGIPLLTWPFVIGTWLVLFYLNAPPKTDGAKAH